MSRGRIIDARNLVFFKKIKNIATLSHETMMEGEIPGLYSYCWTTSWNCNSIQNSIDMECSQTKLMKYNKNMKDLLIEERFKYDLVYLV